MEGFIVDHDYQRYREKDCQHQSPRLPTPETSRSSNEEYEPRHPDEPRRQPPEFDFRYRPALHKFIDSAVMAQPRRDSRNDSVPQSPSRQPFDPLKLSLPPLQSIFGRSISSPPSSPHPHSATIQPSPCEPSYITSTFKPPSLYPHKKQKTEFAGSFALPGVPTGTLDASPNARHPRAGIVCPSPSALIDARQTRLQAVPDLSSLSRVPISPVSVRTASPSPHYPIRNYIHPSHYMHRAPEQTAVSASFDRRHAYLSDRRVPRRSSTGVYGSYHPNSCDPSHARHHSRQIDHAYHIQDYPSRLDQRFGPSDERFSPDFALGTCESVQPSFFTPSAYEYQHGKVRKRSNLPKQSTEIMKTWFDQNISNPYPSEDQKALFSSVTGISMTQVSNWFINHRRRCPELREKRGKGRGGAGDL